MKDTPLVSICCTTYNHEGFIRDAIEGFLMQKTEFLIEIVIHDDASTDRTADIIREYVKAYPGLIVPILQTQNQYSQGIKSWSNFVFPAAKGKYIALCEGDDYWTDPFKLQKQVDFLELNPDFSMCFHPSNIIFNEDLVTIDAGMNINHKYEEKEYTAEEILENWIVPTASVIFRNSLPLNVFRRLSNPNYIVGDSILFLSLAEFGKIWCFKDVMAIYRRHEGGVTSKTTIAGKIKFANHLRTLGMDFSKRYLNYCSGRLFGFGLEFLKHKLFFLGMRHILWALLKNPVLLKKYLSYRFNIKK